MSIQSAIEQLVKTLTPQYGTRESASIARWLFDDYFNVKINNPNDELLFASLLQNDFESISKRLENGEPIQYITGFTWFYGLKLKVNPTV